MILDLRFSAFIIVFIAKWLNNQLFNQFHLYGNDVYIAYLYNINEHRSNSVQVYEHAHTNWFIVSTYKCICMIWCTSYLIASLNFDYLPFPILTYITLYLSVYCIYINIFQTSRSCLILHISLCRNRIRAYPYDMM